MIKGNSLTRFVCIAVLSTGILAITGCWNKTISENNNTTEQPIAQSSEKELSPDMRMADVWMNLPENVDLYWRTDVKGANEYETKTEYKRNNDVMTYVEGLKDDAYVTQNQGGAGEEYYFYHYLEDYNWSSYGHFVEKGWDSWYFKGVYPASPQSYCFGKPWNILDDYSDNHETIEIEGIGAVDTVTGTDDEGYTYYYSKDLGFNVKIENNVQTWQLVKFDTNVSGFPHDLPDMKTIDNKENSDNSDFGNADNNSSKVIEGEGGELIILDE